MNQDERTKLIEEYGRGYDVLCAALDEIPREAWEFKAAPTEWSVHELIVHMRDSEYVGVIRLHKLIAEPGSTLMPYDEGQWAQALNYQTVEMEDALEIFRLARRTTHQLLRSLPERVFANEVVHPQWDKPYTMGDWLQIYVDHVPEHIAQLQQIHQAWKERTV